MFLRRETMPTRNLMNNLSRRTREESCSALAGVASPRKVLCSPPESHLILSRQSLMNSREIQNMVSIFSLNRSNKHFPKCHCMDLLHDWQSGHTCNQYKNQNTLSLGGMKGFKLIKPFSLFLLPICQHHQNSSWAPDRLTFMCKWQRKSL